MGSDDLDDYGLWWWRRGGCPTVRGRGAVGVEGALTWGIVGWIPRESRALDVDFQLAFGHKQPHFHLTSHACKRRRRQQSDWAGRCGRQRQCAGVWADTLKRLEAFVVTSWLLKHDQSL